MSRLVWLLLGVVLLAGCNDTSNESTGPAGPMGPAGPQGEQGPPGSQPDITCAADQVLTFTASGWTCISPAPLAVMRVRQGRYMNNTNFSAVPVTDAQIAVSCPDGWQLARVSCTSGLSTVVASTHDHRQVVQAVDSSAVYGNLTLKVWVADSSYVLQKNPAAGYSERGQPFDIVLPGNAIDGSGSSGSCTFNGTVGAFTQGNFFADGVCVKAPTAPTGPGTCDTSANCPAL